MRALVLAAAVLLAGCVQTPAPEAATLESEAPEDTLLAPLGLAGSGCLQGGGHSVHPRMFDPLPDPWDPADILDDVGPQLLYSEVPDPASPIPSKGNTIGNYHATVWCDAWTLDGEPRDDLFMGFVGMKVEAPPFDPAPEGVTHHYLVTVIATNDDEVLTRLDAAGFGPLTARAERTTSPAGALRIQMWTDGNGDYDSLFIPKEMGPNTATHIRLWFQQGYAGHTHDTRAASESGYRPIALDLLSTGGTHHTAQAQGYFSHMGTDHHSPLPGAGGQTAALMYDGFDRIWQWGPRPDVTLTDIYEH